VHASSLALAVDLVPEGILLLAVLLLLGLALRGAPQPPRSIRAITALALVAAGGSQLAFLRGMPAAGYHAYSDGLMVDRYTLFLVVTLCLVALLGVVGGAGLTPRIGTHVAEYHAILLAAVLGGALLVAAREMVAFWVALELLSVALAMLVAMVKTDRRGSEAAVKQLIVGGAASATLLYGLALLYGVSGSTVLTDVGRALQPAGAASALGLALVVGALLVKVGTVPFHHWVPDTAAGAPPVVAGLVLGLGGTAVTASLARVVVTAFPSAAGSWTALVALVAALSMVYGNLAALVERSLRRLLGHLAVAQAGVVLMGLLAHPLADRGIAALLVALATGAVTLLGLFAALPLLDGGAGDGIGDCRGLGRRSPLAAAMLGLGLASVVGVPPLAGFFARLFVLEAAVLAGYAWLVVLAVAMSVVGAVAVLRVVKLMVVDVADEDASPLRPAVTPVRIAVGACVLATVALGAVAQPLFALASGGAGSIH
jgi:proton-translocating NADH-quinone oxidoreductase chain N